MIEPLRGNVDTRIDKLDQGDYDAIVLDLFEGPHARTDANRDPLYGRQAIERIWRALSPGGVLGVWAEARDQAFESRLRSQGFSVDTHRPGRGGLRHWIALARRPDSSGPRDGKERDH